MRTALAIGIFSSAACAAAAVEPAVRLLVPYPVSGPREIQGVDRATRAYRMIAAQAVPAITELMAAQVTQAVTGRGETHVLRERTSRLGAARAQALLTASDHASITLVLAGAEAVLIEPELPGTGAWRPRDELTLVAAVAVMPFALLCNPQACRDGTLAALERAAANGRARFGSAGERSLGHVAGELLRRSFAVEALHVPYHGGHAALGATIGGQVDWMFAALPLALPQLGNGKLVALGLTAGTPFPLLPEVPLLRQTGAGPLVVESWFAVFAGSHAQRDRVAALRQRLHALGRSGAARTGLLLRGLVPAEESIEDFQARIAADAARWSRLP